jgi:transcriptional regulator with XRE-family HTH domain
MVEIKGWTLEELAEKLGMSKNATQARIMLRKVEPLFNGSIYPPDTYDKIKDAKVGRPAKKPDPSESEKPAK